MVSRPADKVMRCVRVSHSADERQLNRAEREHARQFTHAADRDAYVVAHRLVRICAGRLLGVRASTLDVGHCCPHCGPGVDHGRPLIVGQPQVWVSLSHTRGYAAAIAAWVPCGIDVEANLDPPVVPLRALASAEQRWLASRLDSPCDALQLWVRKEALIKAGAATLDRARQLCVVTAGTLAERFGGYRLDGWQSHGVTGAWAMDNTPF